MKLNPVAYQPKVLLYMAQYWGQSTIWMRGSVCLQITLSWVLSSNCTRGHLDWIIEKKIHQKDCEILEQVAQGRGEVTIPEGI